MIYLILALLFNLWIFRILTLNFFVAVLVLLVSWFLFKYQENSERKLSFPLLLSLLLLIFFQIRTTQKTSLTAISNDDRRIIDMRLRAYPFSLVRVGHWLEERKESMALYKISQNFFENLDPNLYFFANHPRERVGIREFEKFPYILLPFFFLGIVRLKNKVFWAVSFAVPLLILSFIGNQNNLGSFSLFPFFAVSIAEGLRQVRSLNKWVLAIVFLLVFVQIISYEIA
jgi:hypothetical protein